MQVSVLVSLVLVIQLSVYHVHGAKVTLPRYPLDSLVEWKPLVVDQGGRELPGEMGKAVDIPEDKKEEADKTYSVNQLNLVASNMISLNRSLADARHVDCLEDQYPVLLPPTSVIIIFHNEAWSTLLRSVHSVISSTNNAMKHQLMI